jgi:hypothetical protein
LEDNIKMGLREIGWDAIDWNDLAQDMDGFYKILGNS